MTSSLSGPAALSQPESHQIFRAVLDALSRPGIPASLPEHPLPRVLLPVMALADLEAPVAVIEESGEYAELVRTITGAEIVEPTRARIVDVTRPLSEGELTTLCRGTILAPEAGALTFLTVPDFESGPRWTLIGPGIDGQQAVRISGLPADFLTARQVLVGGFPTGVDFVFVTPDGRAIGLPRTTHVIEEDS
ncbi:MAG TPA: phosphonate C-P lyase system protein PhnH [Mycobacteriales bacterium]|nr:phosphonate C-P lyase system protein PhnH [Mycobacteriales bacterium]